MRRRHSKVGGKNLARSDVGYEYVDACDLSIVSSQKLIETEHGMFRSRICLASPISVRFVPHTGLVAVRQ
jgi:hypothetical protein